MPLLALGGGDACDFSTDISDGRAMAAGGGWLKVVLSTDDCSSLLGNSFMDSSPVVHPSPPPQCSRLLCLADPPLDFLTVDVGSFEA